ncbi:hypothetical protein [Streptomyces asiaticus]
MTMPGAIWFSSTPAGPTGTSPPNPAHGPRAAVRAERRATGFAQSRDFVAWCWGHRIALPATDTFAVEVLAGPAS